MQSVHLFLVEVLFHSTVIAKVVHYFRSPKFYRFYYVKSEHVYREEADHLSAANPGEKDGLHWTKFRSEYFHVVLFFLRVNIPALRELHVQTAKNYRSGQPCLNALDVVALLHPAAGGAAYV